MKTLWNEENRKEILNRIGELTSPREPEWGEMNVHQMVVHAGDVIRLAIGELKIHTTGRFPSSDIVTMALSRPLPKNFMSAVLPEFATPSAEWGEDFETLQKLPDRLASVDKDEKWPLHPVFGPITFDQWGIFSHQHLDHHLRQFGV